MAGLSVAGIASVVGLGLRVGSTIVGGIAQARGGRAEKEAAYFEADQLDSLAKEERAAGQQEAFEIDRQVNTLLSVGNAAAAASGAGASDITVNNVQADLATAGKARSATAQYTAGQRAEGLQTQAKLRRMGGRASQTAGRLAAFGTIVGGIGGAASDFATFRSTYGAEAPVLDPMTGDFYPTNPAPRRVGLLARIRGG